MVDVLQILPMANIPNSTPPLLMVISKNLIYEISDLAKKCKKIASLN